MILIKNKILTFSLILTLVVLCACGDNKTAENPKPSSGVDIYVSDDVDVLGNKKDKDNNHDIYDDYYSSDNNEATESPTIDESTTHDGLLKVYFIDVGQADCILIQIDNDENILIDGGNNADGDDLVDYLRYLEVDTIDTIVATHPHEDHIGGLDTVIDNIEVDKIYMPYVSESDIPTTVTYKDFLNAVYDNELIVYQSKNNDIIYKSDFCKVEIISPNEVEAGDLNDYSVVVKLTYGNNSFLFTGDASVKINEYIMNNYSSDFLDIDVLKVGHHGSRTSTNDEWIKTLTPEYAVIMCEDGNQYGHPHKEAINALEKNNITTYRTDIDGTILITSDGSNLSIETKLTGDYPLGNKKFNISNVK